MMPLGAQPADAKSGGVPAGKISQAGGAFVSSWTARMELFLDMIKLINLQQALEVTPCQHADNLDT
jgi:hypothetical protein